MPESTTTSQVHVFLDRAFRPRPGHPGIFSRPELRSLRRMLAYDPPTGEAMVALVDRFREALAAGSLDLSPSRRDRIVELFDTLDAEGRLPADLPRPEGEEDWVTVLAADPAEPAPVPAPAPAPPPSPEAVPLGVLDEQPVTLTGPVIQAGPDRIDLSAEHDRGAALAVAWGLLRAGLPDTPGAARALAAVLIEVLPSERFAIPVSEVGKLRQGGVTLALAALLARCAEHAEALPSTLVDALVDHAASVEQPAVAAQLALALQALGHPLPEDARPLGFDEHVAAFDGMVDGDRVVGEG